MSRKESFIKEHEAIKSNQSRLIRLMSLNNELKHLCDKILREVSDKIFYEWLHCFEDSVDDLYTAYLDLIDQAEVPPVVDGPGSYEDLPQTPNGPFCAS